MADKTVLILVSGAPGSGKSTLARRLAADLQLPLLARDDLKEVMLDSLGFTSRQDSRLIGGASFEVLFRVLQQCVGLVPGLVVNCNFTRGTSEAELAPLLERSNAVLIHCQAPPDVLEQRIRSRLGDPDRHPGHFDQEALPEVLEAVANGAYAPLDLPVPLLEVDSSDGFNPDLPKMREFIRERTGYSTP